MTLGPLCSLPILGQNILKMSHHPLNHSIILCLLVNIKLLVNIQKHNNFLYDLYSIWGNECNADISNVDMKLKFLRSLINCSYHIICTSQGSSSPYIPVDRYFCRIAGRLQLSKRIALDWRPHILKQSHHSS